MEETVMENFICMLNQAVEKTKTIVFSFEMEGGYFNCDLKACECITNEEFIYIAGEDDTELKIDVSAIKTIEYEEEEGYIIDIGAGQLYINTVL